MTIEERVEKMCQLIWLDVSEPTFPLKDRYRLMKERILYGMNASHAEGKAEGAEQAAAKIVHCYECVGGDENTPEKDQCALWDDGKEAYCSSGQRIPASVLAPTEQDKITRLAEVNHE